MIQSVKKHENNTIQANKQKRLAKFYKNSKNKPNNIDGPKPQVTRVYGETSPMHIKHKPIINVPTIHLDVMEKQEPANNNNIFELFCNISPENITVKFDFLQHIKQETITDDFEDLPNIEPTNNITKHFDFVQNIEEFISNNTNNTEYFSILRNTNNRNKNVVNMNIQDTQIIPIIHNNTSDILPNTGNRSNTAINMNMHNPQFISSINNDATDFGILPNTGNRSNTAINMNMHNPQIISSINNDATDFGILPNTGNRSNTAINMNMHNPQFISSINNDTTDFGILPNTGNKSNTAINMNIQNLQFISNNNNDATDFGILPNTGNRSNTAINMNIQNPQFISNNNNDATDFGILPNTGNRSNTAINMDIIENIKHNPTVPVLSNTNTDFGFSYNIENVQLDFLQNIKHNPDVPVHNYTNPDFGILPNTGNRSNTAINMNIQNPQINPNISYTNTDFGILPNTGNRSNTAINMNIQNPQINPNINNDATDFGILPNTGNRSNTAIKMNYSQNIKHIMDNKNSSYTKADFGFLYNATPVQLDFLQNIKHIIDNKNSSNNTTDFEFLCNATPVQLEFLQNIKHIMGIQDSSNNTTDFEFLCNATPVQLEFLQNIKHIMGIQDSSNNTTDFGILPNTGNRSNSRINMDIMQNIKHITDVPVHINDTTDFDIIPNTKPRIIPLNIFQTWYTLDLPPKMKANVELLKKQNPEFTHYLYDDKMCIDFIREYFDDSVIWAFDKLKPGAYKADLWRYCVLYIHGGIYLDIKMYSVNNFKLIQLTDQEYFPKDRFCNNIHGIWQGLLVCLPHNIILYKSIMLICQNVKNNVYGPSALSITGPHMICNFIKLCNIQNSPIRFDIDYNSVASNSTSMLYLNNKLILRNYEEYRNDSIFSTNRSHYSSLWTTVNIYNYPILLPKYTKEFTNIIKTKFNTFFSGTPTIVQDPNNSNQYIVNLRWINYKYNENGSKHVIPKQWISLNSRFTVDNLFEKISNEIGLTENYEIEKNFISRGIEDIRIIKFNDKHFYLATRFNPILKRPYVCSNEYIIDDTEYNLNKTYINPIFYNVKKTIKAEKNWAMFEYKTKLSVVYDWYPLQIGCINYNTHELDIIETKTDMPEFFQNTRGSTVGCHFDNEIWFVLHKAQNNRKLKNRNPIYNYQHFFAVFDLNMNLKRHSELFKFGDKMVEFCTGLIMEEERLILSYSLLDTHSYVSTYDYDTIYNSIKWYKY